ncbi:MAG: AMP-binding protein, partial [Mariprofundaceae bacterium]|nr:AMP-binding protein [Mariprofundaceae bacterium]
MSKTPNHEANHATDCPGLEQVARANCLSDLLFHSPAAWLQRPTLRRRPNDGNWTGLNRITVQQRVLRLAAWLESQGIEPGDRVGILGHNSVEWFISDFAILRLGAVTVPAYFTDPAESVEYVFNDAGCKMLLVEPGEQQEKLNNLDIKAIPFSGA